SVGRSQPNLVGKDKATTDALLNPVHWKVPTTQWKGIAMKEQNGNGFAPSIAQAIEEMKAFQGDSFSLERINLAELERRTGVSRSRLRRLKKNSFHELPRSTTGCQPPVAMPGCYLGLLGGWLWQGVEGSSVVW